LLPGRWYILLAGIVASGVGALFHHEDTKDTKVKDEG